MGELAPQRRSSIDTAAWSRQPAADLNQLLAPTDAMKVGRSCSRATFSAAACGLLRPHRRRRTRLSGRPVGLASVGRCWLLDGVKPATKLCT